MSKKFAHRKILFLQKLHCCRESALSGKCTYQVDGNQYEGYIKGKNYRGKIESEGKIGEVIMQDNCMWTWNTGETQGMKMCYELDEADSTLWGEVDENTEGISHGCVGRILHQVRIVHAKSIFGILVVLLPELLADGLKTEPEFKSFVRILSGFFQIFRPGPEAARMKV